MFILMFLPYCSEFIIMCQVTVITTTPPVAFVCSSTWTITTTVKMVATSVGLAAASGKQDMVMPSLLILKKLICIVGLVTVLQQQPKSHMPSQAYVNYPMGYPQASFLFQS